MRGIRASPSGWSCAKGMTVLADDGTLEFTVWAQGVTCE